MLPKKEGGLFGLDWSGGTLKNKTMGLLTDPDQLQGLLGNPLFNMGMGILAENGKWGGNAASGAMKGLANSKQAADSEEDRKRAQEARDAMKQYFDSLMTAQQQRGIQNIVDPLMPQQPGDMMMPPGSIMPGPGQPMTPDQQRNYWQMILMNGPGGVMNG